MCVCCTLCYDANDFDFDFDGDVDVDDNDDDVTYKFRFNRNKFGRLHATPSKNGFVH